MNPLSFGSSRKMRRKMMYSMSATSSILLLVAMAASPAATTNGAAFAFTSPSSYYHSPIQRRTIKSSHHASNSDGSSFESLGLSEDLVTVAQKMNWQVPTAVQQLSIPAILDMANDFYDGDGDGDGSRSSSLWCEGPTGSGKTGGFALPLLQILMQQKRLADITEQPTQKQGHINTLILCPTRELAAQTGSVLQRLASYLPSKRKISIDVIYGGTPMDAQVARLARKRRSGTDIDIVVATPGRLVDVLKHKDSNDPTMSAMERRILDAFDSKSLDGSDGGYAGSNKKKGKRGRGGGGSASSLTLNEIQEMDLDRVDDDGRASLDEMLLDLDYLVLDEADRLLGGAFKDEVDELLSLFPSRKSLEENGEGTKLKTLLFSATFPEQIETRVDRVLARMSAGVPLRVSTSAAMLQRVTVSDEGEDDSNSDGGLSNRQKKHIASTTPIQNVLPDMAPNIQHRVIRLDERDRTQALRFLLDQEDTETEWDRVFVFVATRYATEHVTRKLRRYGHSAAELHGKLDQAARERRLKAFRSGKTRVLISTDLAARGIDVEGLPVVVNYDLPRSAADFTHRTGRTGRAGKSGLAISFISAKSESHFNAIEKKELQRKQKIEREVLPQFPPNEEAWEIQSAAATMSVPGATHSQQGLAHDRMFGGVKGRRKSKKDKLREAQAAKAAQQK